MDQPTTTISVSTDYEAPSWWTDYEANWNETVHKLIDADLEFDRKYSQTNFTTNDEFVLKISKINKFIKCKSITFYYAYCSNYIGQLREKIIEWAKEFVLHTSSIEHTYGEYESLISQNGVELCYHWVDSKFVIYYDFDFTDINNEEEQHNLDSIWRCVSSLRGICDCCD